MATANRFCRQLSEPGASATGGTASARASAVPPVADAPGSPLRSPPVADAAGSLGLNVELYRKLYLIRAAEEQIMRRYGSDCMKTPMHMSMGGEMIAAGVCQALPAGSQVMGSYRSHALYLAQTLDPVTFFAEMYGKATGCARGKAGSMHLSLPGKGMMGSSAIVAGQIPVAVGLALANKYQNNGRMAAVFFGDAALDEGVFWESFNAACLYELPMLFVCEDNGLAIHTDERSRHGYPSINRIVAQFRCHAFEEKTTDVARVYESTCRAIAAHASTGRPAFLRFHYYRYLEHVGVGQDFHEGYRSEQIYRQWQGRDPVNLQRAKLVGLGIDAGEVAELERIIDAEIARSIELAEQAPAADVSETYAGVLRCAS